MDEKKLRKAVRQKEIVWNKHTFERMLEREISRKDIIEVILKGEAIEDYPDDKPYSSALIFGKVGKKPMHVVAALDNNNDICYIITAYYPDDKHFEHDYKTRKRK